MAKDLLNHDVGYSEFMQIRRAAATGSMQAVPGQSGTGCGMNVPLHDYTVVPKDCGHCRKIYSRFRQMSGEGC